MSHLYELLAWRVDAWRSDGYPAESFPAIGEIFEWASDETGALRYLRRPQLRALETTGTCGSSRALPTSSTSTSVSTLTRPISWMPWASGATR